MTAHNQQQLHDMESDSFLGKGNDDGAGDKFYVLGERCETDNPDSDDSVKTYGKY